MAAQKAARKPRLGKLLCLSALAFGGVSLWLLLLGASIAGSPVASAGALRSSTGTSTPTLIPTVGVGATSTVAPTATSVATVEPTATAKAIPTATSANNGNGNGGGGGTTNGPTGPQSTEVALSQPTVNASSSPIGGLSPSTFGANGLLIATTLGCVVALLGIAVGAIALYALVQNGYGPFLRALALGTGHRKRRKSDTGWGNARGAAGEVRTRQSESGWNTADNRRTRPPVSRRDRDGW